jgi:hypothetical protein
LLRRHRNRTDRRYDDRQESKVNDFLHGSSTARASKRRFTTMVFLPSR